MADTTTALPPAEAAELAIPHDADGQTIPLWSMPSLPGAGALRSTANDMLQELFQMKSK